MITKYFKEGAILPKKLVVEKDLMEHTVAELRAMATSAGIVLPTKASKAEIVKALSESKQ